MLSSLSSFFNVEAFSFHSLQTLLFLFLTSLTSASVYTHTHTRMANCTYRFTHITQNEDTHLCHDKNKIISSERVCYSCLRDFDMLVTALALPITLPFKW